VVWRSNCWKTADRFLRKSRN